MVTLEIKDKQLNTGDKEFTVQIEDQNPATKFDEIVGSKAFGIDLPINDTNRIELGNPERFEKMGSADDRRFEQAVLRHFGQITISGTLIIEEARKNYSGWLRDTVGNLAEKVANKNINQFTLGGEKTFVNKTTYDQLTDDYACPKIFNRHFWNNRGKKSERTVDAVDLEGDPFEADEEDYELTWQFFENEQFFVNFPTVSGVKADGANTAPVVSPMLFLWRITERILSDNYIYVKENFLKDDGNFQKLIVYNQFNIAKQSMSGANQTLREYNLIDNIFVTLPVWVVSGIEWSATGFYYKDLVPKESMGKWILGLQNLLNVVFSFNDLNECRIVDRQKLLTQPAYDIDEYMVGEWELGTRKDVTVKLSMEHDPQDAAFSDRWQDLSDIRDNIQEPVGQYADLIEMLEPESEYYPPALDEIRKVISENKYYQYHWYVATTVDADNNEMQADVLGWEMITIAFQPYFFNDGDREVEEIETCFSTLQQSENGYPIVMQRGNSEAFKSQPEAFTPRLLFYLGGAAANYRTATMSLDFDGDDGLATTRWNYWLPFWANRLPATGTFKFPAPVFYYIKNNKAILPLRTRHGSFIIDKIEAVAGNADTIETTLTVFKRESIETYETGTTPGTGEITEPEFTPLYLGLNSSGKPYLVDSLGNVRIPPAWGNLSTTTFAKSVCIDYDAESHQLFVGGINGTLHITDLTDIDNPVMKSIQVYSGGAVSCVRFVNGILLIGRDLSNKIYVQLHYADIASYASGQAGEATLTNGYTAKDFAYADGYYYSCSKAGEIHRTNSPVGAWTELFDVKADFRKMVVTDNKIIAFGKEDGRNDDREFYALRSNPTSWSEIDVEAAGEIYVSDAVDYGSDRALIADNQENLGVKIVNSNNTTTNLTPMLAQYCGGICMNNGKAAVGIIEASNATKIALYVNSVSWSYINVPQFFTKLFMY
jgi:hypothetical protein